MIAINIGSVSAGDYTYVTDNFLINWFGETFDPNSKELPPIVFDTIFNDSISNLYLSGIAAYDYVSKTWVWDTEYCKLQLGDSTTGVPTLKISITKDLPSGTIKLAFDKTLDEIAITPIDIRREETAFTVAPPAKASS